MNTTSYKQVMLVLILLVLKEEVKLIDLEKNCTNKRVQVTQELEVNKLLLEEEVELHLVLEEIETLQRG
jgi:hypothetical protein